MNNKWGLVFRGAASPKYTIERSNGEAEHRK
jgi:hypothetical protein